MYTRGLGAQPGLVFHAVRSLVCAWAGGGFSCCKAAKAAFSFSMGAGKQAARGASPA